MRVKLPPDMVGPASGWPMVPERVKEPPELVPPPPSMVYQSIAKGCAAADARTRQDGRGNSNNTIDRSGHESLLCSPVSHAGLGKSIPESRLQVRRPRGGYPGPSNVIGRAQPWESSTFMDIGALAAASLEEAEEGSEVATVDAAVEWSVAGSPASKSKKKAARSPPSTPPLLS